MKAAISVPYLARTVAGTAWAGTVAAVGARRAPRSALPAPTTHALGTNGPPTRRFQVRPMARQRNERLLRLTGSLATQPRGATNNNATKGFVHALHPTRARERTTVGGAVLPAHAVAPAVRKRVRSYGLLNEQTVRRAAARR